MCRIARLLGNVPFAGRLFNRGDQGGTPAVPNIIRRGNVSLVGEGLTHSFGSGEMKSLALKDVSVELRQGELNLLMGPSGSGKSTLLAVLSGLLRPDGGAVGAMGRDVWGMSEDEMERFRLRHCSYIFQATCPRSPQEQLEIVLKWARLLVARRRKRADHILGQLGLSKAHLRPARLSGRKQRVAIGRALVKNPASSSPTSRPRRSTGTTASRPSSS